MTTLVDSFAIWLADYYLLATLLLAGALAACACLRQPVQRLAIARSTIAALALLAALCALPGWSLVHLLTANDARVGVPLATTGTLDATPPATAQLPASDVVTPTLANAALSSPAAPSTEFWSHTSLSTVLVTAYSVGAACVVAWLVLGSVAAHRLCRSATPAPTQLVALLSEMTAARDGAHPGAELRVSDGIDVAVALGVFRPFVLLPSRWMGGWGNAPVDCSEAEKGAWGNAPENSSPQQCNWGGVGALPQPRATEGLSHEALRSVLAHETAHLRNGDLRWLAASRVMLILLWAQPLYWLLRRRLRADQESLADAAAAEVTSRQRYAEQLVAWARHVSARPAIRLSAAVGLWERPSQLRQRIALLLDDRFTVIRNCPRGWRRGASCVVILLTMLLSTLTVNPQSNDGARGGEAPPTSSPTNSAATATATGGNQKAEVTGVTVTIFNKPGVPNTIAGQCLDENGKPLQNVEVVLARAWLREARREPISQQLTGVDGRFHFANVVDIKESYSDGRIPVLSSPDSPAFQISARAAGRASASVWAMQNQVARFGAERKLLMPPASKLRGRITGPKGEPIADALVSIGQDQLERWEGFQTVRTDVEGNYEISDAPQMESGERTTPATALRSVQARGSADQQDLLVLHRMIHVQHPQYAHQHVRINKIPGVQDVPLEASAVMTGRVIDGETGQPLANARVQVHSSQGQAVTGPDENPSESFAIVRVDAQGQYRINSLRAGTYDVWAEAQDRVGPGVQSLRTSSDQVSTAPDIVMTRGGTIRVQLVDAKATQPIALQGNERAQFYMQPGPAMKAPAIVDLIDGKFEFRSIPGKNVVRQGIISSGDKYKWIYSGREPITVNVVEGETIDVTVPVEELAAQANGEGASSDKERTSASRNDPSNSDESRSRIKEATQLIATRRYREALSMLSPILSDQPDDVAALLLRAEAWMQMGEFAKAVEDYEKLVKLNPAYPRILVVYNNLAYLLAAAPDDRIRNGRRAVELAKRANQLLQTPSPDALDTLAAAYAEAGDFDIAIETQEQAIKLEPNREVFRKRLQLYQSGKPTRADPPNEQPVVEEEPNATTESALDNGGAATTPSIPIIVAQHMMLSEGKIIEWVDVERRIAAIPNPKLAHPSFKFTHGALPEREEEIRAKIWELRKRVELAGHSWGSLLPRASARYDAIRTAADLVPNAAHRVQGTVVTDNGQPIDDAEVVLLPPAPDSVPYKTLDVYLRNERLRTPEDEIVTRSHVGGRFAVYPQPGTPYYLIALHRDGFGLVRSDEFATSQRIAIRPWAHVKGSIRSDEQFEQSADVTVRVPAEADWPETTFHQYSVDLGPAAPDGSFELAFVPPALRGTLGRHVKGAEGTSYGLPVQEFELAPGETLAADIGLPSEADTQQIEDLKSRLQQQRDEGSTPGRTE